MMIALYLAISFIIAIALFINKSKMVAYMLTALFVVLHISLSIYAVIHTGATELAYFTFDHLAVLLLSTLSVIALPAFIHSVVYIENHKEAPHTRSIYLASFVLLSMAISAGYLSNHIAVTWIFTEITTLSASALIYHHRNKLALEGTWKYAFISAISISFIFIGILFLSLSLQHAGSSDLSFSNLMQHRNNLNPVWLRLSYLFIFTGFTAKAGLVPMFTAGIDAKDKAPAPAGAMMASVLMNLGFIGIFRMYSLIAGTSLMPWAQLVTGIAAVLSILVSAVYMARVKNIKRMFAYSGIEHMGLAMLGVAAGGIGYYAAILHIMLHALIKSSLFFQFNQLYRVFQNKSIQYLGNYFAYNSTGAFVMLIGFISISAIPPSGMFVSEFLIIKSLFTHGYIGVLIFVLVLLTYILWAFGRNMFKVLFLPVENFDASTAEKINPLESVTQFLLLGLAIYLGLNPPEWLIFYINQSVALLPDAKLF